MAEANLQSPGLAVWNAENPPTPEIPSDIQAFAVKHGLQSYLAIAANLVEKNFTLKTQISLSKVVDWESETEWIEILASVSGDVASVQAAHSDYTHEWLRSVPLDKSLLIRLALDLG